MKTPSNLFYFLASLFLIVGCQSNPPDSTNNTTELVVSVAASLQDGMKAIQPLYAAENPNIEIIYNFASSGSLQNQIEQGAPVDVFISASVAKMDALQQKELILDETRQDLLKNQIVLVTSPENNQIKTFQDLTPDNLTNFAIGEPKSVPAGQYAKEVLTTLNLWVNIEPKTIYGKDVRQILNYVETGNIDAGMVYATDAKLSDTINITATAPEGSHTPIVYPVAVIKNSQQVEAAKAFVQFLTQSSAQETFEQYGFTSIKK